jgi:hypothetical protein
MTPARVVSYIALSDNRAVSSAGERTLHTGGVVGSIPTPPTISASNRVLLNHRRAPLDGWKRNEA